MNNQRIFSGVQPSGSLHIGNYLGAIKNWVELQEKFEAIFCIVDLHAITVPQNPEELRKKTIEVAKIYLAAGINPEKSTIFIQSHIHEHAELAWILSTIAKMSDLFKMTQFIDKALKGKRAVLKKKIAEQIIERKVLSKEESEKYLIYKTGVGLLNYPVLMAADILLYDTNVVPVGEDQLQHIELARTSARRFNKKFGETFIIPEPYIQKETMPARNATPARNAISMAGGHSVAGGRIMGLDDPTKKMSKSAASEYNYISLTDDKETVRRKIKKAVTDSGSEIKYSDEKPALKNLINIYASFSGKTFQEIEKMYKGKGYADFKNGLADVIIKFLKPFQKKINAISNEQVLDILRKGAEKAYPIAHEKMKEVKKKVGFVI